MRGTAFFAKQKHMNFIAFRILAVSLVLAIQVGCTETSDSGSTNVERFADAQSARTVTGRSNGEIEQIRLPKATPFDEPIKLQFRPVKHFSYSSNKYMGGSGGPERFLWGFAMRGSVRESVISLVWKYTVHNRGHDNVLRSCGEVEVVTDAFGVVSKSEVISRDEGCISESAYLDSDNLVFPFCCLPENPVRMGTMTRHPVISEMERRKLSELPISLRTVDGDRRRIAEGMVEREGQDYLLVREQGAGTFNIDLGNVSGTITGYQIIDPRTGMTRTARRQTKN